MTASITSWGQKVGGDNGNMAMLPWLPFRNRLMKLSNFWRSTTKMIYLNVYNTCVFVLWKGKSYEHSLIIYWTALVYVFFVAFYSFFCLVCLLCDMLL